MVRKIVSLLIFGVIALLWPKGPEQMSFGAEAAQALFSSLPQAPDTYYRMIASVTVDRDEKIEINVVVRCGWTTRQPAGSAARYFPIRAPYIYGVRTKAGHAVLVHVPDACGAGMVERMPADFLPFVLWADKAEDLEFLTAYTSEEGYEHPSARIALDAVRFETASADDYQAWKRSAPPNVVPAKDPFQADYSKTDWRTISVAPGQDPSTARYGAIGCYGMIRYPIPESMRDRVRGLWPADRPHFWAPTGWKDNNVVEIQTATQANWLGWFSRELSPVAGLLRRNGGGTFYGKGQRFWRGDDDRTLAQASPVDTYPLDAEISYYHKRPDGVRSTKERMSVDLRDGAPRGQMYCARWPYFEQSIVNSDQTYSRMTYDINVGDQIVVSKTGPDNSGLGLIVIEDDKFWFEKVGIRLWSESGGWNDARAMRAEAGTC
jgi:hypothetical protein